MFCCFKQKTAYEMRISDRSSDVCSSDLLRAVGKPVLPTASTPPSSPPPSSPPGAAMPDTPTPTPTFRPAIAKRHNVDLPTAVVHASAGSHPTRSDSSPDAKALATRGDRHLTGKTPASDTATDGQND